MRSLESEEDRVIDDAADDDPSHAAASTARGPRACAGACPLVAAASCHFYGCFREMLAISVPGVARPATATARRAGSRR